MTVDHRRSPTLPTLEPGVTLLETDGRTTGALHSLVLDHLLVEGGSAVWVDADGHGATRPLARIAPSLRVLDRIQIARVFTPWQHRSLLCDLPAELAADTDLVVLPAVDRFYRSDDLPRGGGDRMLSAGVERIADLAAATDASVLLTCHDDDPFVAPVRALADDVVRCERTGFGPRFTGADFETLVYLPEGGTLQTTLAFWERVLARRHAAVAAVDAPTEVSARGSY